MCLCIKSISARNRTLGCQSCCRLENNQIHQEAEQGQLPQCQEEEGGEEACLQEGVEEEGVCCHRHPCPPLLQQQIELIQINYLTHIACLNMIVPSLQVAKQISPKGKHALGKRKPAMLETCHMCSCPDSKQSKHCMTPYTLMSQTLLAETAGMVRQQVG